MGRTDMLKLVNNPLQQCKQCVLKELVMPKNGQGDTNAAYRFIKNQGKTSCIRFGEHCAMAAFPKRITTPTWKCKLGKVYYQKHLFVMTNIKDWKYVRLEKIRLNLVASASSVPPTLKPPFLFSTR